MVPDLIIFDCDGVLIDSELIACRVDAECLTEIGWKLTLDDILDRYVGLSAAAMFADLEARAGRRLPADFAETLRRRLATEFETELAAIPGVVDVLDQLSCRSCVASSSAPERLRHSLSLAGLYRPLRAPHLQCDRGPPRQAGAGPLPACRRPDGRAAPSLPRHRGQRRRGTGGMRRRDDGLRIYRRRPLPARPRRAASPRGRVGDLRRYGAARPARRVVAPLRCIR